MDQPTMMRCDRQSMNLTVPGCVRLWKSAVEDKPQPWEGRFNCLACPIGAANAGEPVIETAEAAHLLRTLCPRCRRLSDRIIQGLHCIGCYNRAREVRVGRNGKGTVPILTYQLHADAVLVMDDEGARIVRVEPVLDAAETVLRIAKKAERAMCFMRPPPMVRSPQAEMAFA